MSKEATGSGVQWRRSAADRLGPVLTRVSDRVPRRFVIPLVDAVLAAAAWVLVFTARFDFDLPQDHRARLLVSTIVVTVVQLVANAVRRLSRSMWSTSGMADVVRIVEAVGLAAVVYVPVLFAAYGNGGIPRSAFILGPAVTILVYAGVRTLYRLVVARHRLSLRGSAPTTVLAVGDADSIKDLARELSVEPAVRPAGLLCTERAFKGRLIAGQTVLGSLEDLGTALESTGAQGVVLGLANRDPEVARQVAKVCTDLDRDLYLLAPHAGRLPGATVASRLRGMHLEDLLERNVQGVIETSAVRNAVRGRRVMVTGGGGSIGFELVRQIASFGPARLVIFDISEFNIYRALERLQEEAPHVPVSIVLGDAAETALVESAFREHKPDIVFHAAAYKHVPILEDQQRSAVRSNVFGTLAVAHAAAGHGVETFVLISSDKAVHPSSVMGSTKRIAEMLIGALNRTSVTSFMSVRFGNVLESSGSVVPKFTEQIEAGGPVTVTHPDITRYFMTIPEACELILQTLIVGEPDDILVLDMGAPIKIMDLARQMIRLAGHSRDEIEIAITGLRPGEKLYEELFYADETLLPTPHEKITRAAHQSADPVWLAALLDVLAEGVRTGELPDVRDLLLGEISIDLTRGATLDLIPEGLPSRGPGVRRDPVIPSSPELRLPL